MPLEVCTFIFFLDFHTCLKLFTRIAVVLEGNTGPLVFYESTRIYTTIYRVAQKK